MSTPAKPCERCSLISLDFDTPHTEAQCLQLLLGRIKGLEQTVYPSYLRAWIDSRLGQASVSYIPEPRVAAAFALAMHDATQHRLKTAQELRAALDEMFEGMA